MNVAPPTGPFQIGNSTSPIYTTFFSLVAKLLTAMSESGVTASRPTSFLWVGRMYFDTTLGQPIWYTGSGWVDATGASA